jgi:hypothetical protein
MPSNRWDNAPAFVPFEIGKILLASNEHLRYSAYYRVFPPYQLSKAPAWSDEPGCRARPISQTSDRTASQRQYGASLFTHHGCLVRNSLSLIGVCRFRQVSLGVIVNADNTIGTNPAIFPQNLKPQNKS